MFLALVGLRVFCGFGLLACGPVCRYSKTVAFCIHVDFSKPRFGPRLRQPTGATRRIVTFSSRWCFAFVGLSGLCVCWPVERPRSTLHTAPFFFKAAFVGFLAGFCGCAWCMLRASILAILGLNLGKALGLYFGNFGPESGQGSGPQFWQFWA